MVFEGSTGVYERTYFFNSKCVRKKKKYCMRFPHILGDPGADSGGEGKSKRAGKKTAQKKVKKGENSSSHSSLLFFCPWVSEDDFDMDFKKSFLLLF